ncbi:MAG: hypothetical protein NTW87_21420 [Planctomycetota bacterium]|nr:hypothetical protein [Planctomycetota bacterium]
MRVHASLLLAGLLLSLPASAANREKDLDGQRAPPIHGSVWVGSPVSLDAVKGDVAVLAFWNLDAPC